LFFDGLRLLSQHRGDDPLSGHSQAWDEEVVEVEVLSAARDGNTAATALRLRAERGRDWGRFRVGAEADGFKVHAGICVDAGAVRVGLVEHGLTRVRRVFEPVRPADASRPGRDFVEGCGSGPTGLLSLSEDLEVALRKGELDEGLLGRVGVDGHLAGRQAHTGAQVAVRPVPPPLRTMHEAGADLIANTSFDGGAADAKGEVFVIFVFLVRIVRVAEVAKVGAAAEALLAHEGWRGADGARAGADGDEDVTASSGAFLGLGDGRKGEDSGVYDIFLEGAAPLGAALPGYVALEVAELAPGDVFEAHGCGGLMMVLLRVSWCLCVSGGDSQGGVGVLLVF
jgi:hypothetical protein